jgi:hypothetical protein
MITVQKTPCIRTIPTQLMIWRWPSHNTFGIWTVLYWTQSSRRQFGVSINVWRLAGDTLSITCNFLYCNLQVHRDFLITLYNRVLLDNKCIYLIIIKYIRNYNYWKHNGDDSPGKIQLLYYIFVYRFVCRLLYVLSGLSVQVWYLITKIICTALNKTWR